MYSSRRVPMFAIAWCAGLIAVLPANAQFGGDRRGFPTTEFAEGSKSAAVTVGDLTAGISMVRQLVDGYEEDVPVLVVMVGGARVLEIAGVPSGFDFPAAEASIAEIDPDNDGLEVYFTSYSGGAHCCSSVIVADAVAGAWLAVSVGDFDGDGNYLVDLDQDGLAEVATTDHRFLYQFDCYACSVAPIRVLGIRGGEVFDMSARPDFVDAHRDWLGQIEAAFDPAERWDSPGFLAGWIAAKIRVGEGEEAWMALSQHWDAANDAGEEVCLTGGEPEECPSNSRAVLKFPERLRLFLEQTGYLP